MTDELKLCFTVPEHAQMTVVTELDGFVFGVDPERFVFACAKGVTIDGMSFDDLVHLRDVIQQRIDSFRNRIRRG